MNPKPFSALNHFTVPVAILVTLLHGTPAPGLKNVQARAAIRAPYPVKATRPAPSPPPACRIRATPTRRDAGDRLMIAASGEAPRHSNEWKTRQALKHLRAAETGQRI